jgi:adenylosuccinate lyase
VARRRLPHKHNPIRAIAAAAAAAQAPGLVATLMATMRTNTSEQPAPGTRNGGLAGVC